MITHTVPLRQRPVFGGFSAGVEGIAAAGAPFLGGLITGECFALQNILGDRSLTSHQISYLGDGVSI